MPPICPLLETEIELSATLAKNYLTGSVLLYNLDQKSRPTTRFSPWFACVFQFEPNTEDLEWITSARYIRFFNLNVSLFVSLVLWNIGAGIHVLTPLREAVGARRGIVSRLVKPFVYLCSSYSTGQWWRSARKTTNAFTQDNFVKNRPWCHARWTFAMIIREIIDDISAIFLLFEDWLIDILVCTVSRVSSSENWVFKAVFRTLNYFYEALFFHWATSLQLIWNVILIFEKIIQLKYSNLIFIFKNHIYLNQKRLTDFCICLCFLVICTNRFSGTLSLHFPIFFYVF